MRYRLIVNVDDNTRIAHGEIAIDNAPHDRDLLPAVVEGIGKLRVITREHVPLGDGHELVLHCEGRARAVKS